MAALFLMLTHSCNKKDCKICSNAEIVGAVHTTHIHNGRHRRKTPLNVPGKFYVDSSCIDCDLCRETAPENFGRDDDEGVSYVKKQPDNETEQEACVEAMEGCPVEAIGDDGE